MKKMMKKYGGVIFFYTAIVVMVWAINYRLGSLEKNSPNNLAYIEETTK